MCHAVHPASDTGIEIIEDKHGGTPPARKVFVDGEWAASFALMSSAKDYARLISARTGRYPSARVVTQKEVRDPYYRCEEIEHYIPLREEGSA